MADASSASFPSSFTDYGINGCPSEWLHVGIERGGALRRDAVSLLADVVRTVGDSDRIFVDSPIGLPEGGEGRMCDREARHRLGP